ncbi:MAG: c-type cytochrome [Alphaproteobacteria bacterium]|nr:c-type cytochrome [Alphaproteobacteria bacterium]
MFPLVKKFLKNSALFCVICLSILHVTNTYAQDGKALFSQNCASCHAVHKKLTGPALADVENRGPWSDKAKLHAWIKNSAAFLKTGDKYVNDLYSEYNKTAMNLFPDLSDAEIDAILAYIKTVPDPAQVAANNPGAASKEDEEFTSFYWGIIAIVLATLVLILLQVNSNLKRLADEKQGIPTTGSVPFYRNKHYLALLAVVLFIWGGYNLAISAIGLGRQKDYMPQQPIFYSHKVHAGVNQINCQYCHTGVYQGKQALIPSVNICMNCHMAINEYKGAPLLTADGTPVDGTAEIQKLYEYAGFTPGKAWDESKATPIAWTRIHSLPDHVYFNHAQHVKVGKQDCQTCHGEIQKMDEVKQFSPLSMSWCINCHRNTAVKFKDNGFYSIYEKYHQELKSGKIDSTTGITVEKIGGTECQKCHY